MNMDYTTCDSDEDVDSFNKSSGSSEEQFFDDEGYGHGIEDDNGIDEEGYEPATGENDGEEGTESDSETESYSSNLVDSPGGTSKLWRPIVAKKYLPKVGDSYVSIDEGIEMYGLYADKAGFGVRKNTTSLFADKTIRVRYVICNRAGKIPDKSVDTLDSDASGRKKRNSNFKITECMEKIIFERSHMSSPVCYVKKFVELHNHELYTKEERRYCKRARKLTFKDKEDIVKMSTCSIGATRAHKIQASLKGGYENLGPEKNDYKNFRKKMGNIIGDRDAQMVVDKLTLRMEELNNYTFKYKCVNSVLNCMFWADETDKAYYKEFGDVISFDATFRTNKYGMVFVPFTAIDNHKRSITVGAGLLSSETIESYKWLLEAFMAAHGKEPDLVLTDQDAAVIQAVAAVFKKSKHRLCMWHIMRKLNDKVSKELLAKTDFRKRFHKLVWNIYLEPEVFEKEWHEVIKKYKLQDKRWFKDMYECRDQWIPAYFKQMPMHGLMKTTSRSESTNSYFEKYAHSANFLLFFILNYDTAILKQRNTQRKLEYETKKGNFKLKMPSTLEKHASEVYTNEIFLDVQKEIYRGAWNCAIESVETVNGLQVAIIKHFYKNEELKTKCKVELRMPEVDVKCSCQLFTRMGILCRHIFAVLKNNNVQRIPEQYILRRWRREVISSHLILSAHGLVERQDETARLLTEAFNNIEYCLDRLRGDKDKLLAFVENTRKLKKSVEEDGSIIPASDESESEMLRMLGVRIPDKIEIQVPAGIRNKGSGVKKRLISASEKAAASSTSKSRMCSGCNKIINHNWRTCPVRIAREEAEKNNDNTNEFEE